MLATLTRRLALGAMLMAPVSTASLVQASSHMDAPLITLDPSANTTDVYAFKSRSGNVDYLTTALAVYPFEEPGIGPNNYSFDPAVDYEIHVALGNSTRTGRADLTFRFEFSTTYANRGTILQAYRGVVPPAAQFSANQNLRQTYRVTKIDRRSDKRTVLGDNIMVPPNNQGRVTPFYNQGNNGDAPARGGVASLADLDGYTRNAVTPLARKYMVFAGQRDDGFYADIHSIFDLDFTFNKPAPFDSQGGFNVHTIVLNIPLSELDGAKIAGVFATTTRPNGDDDRKQVGRQGNPLFNEALVAIRDKDRYNRTSPMGDATNFGSYADNPELSKALGVTPIIPGLIRSIFIPDLIKVDLTTPPARLAGDTGFHRLGFFGGDRLKSTFQDPFGNGGFIPGGWPNGRRFGDDVVDIAFIALGAAGSGPDFSQVNADKVTGNDISYNRVFPYAATPLNGRVHGHHGQN